MLFWLWSFVLRPLLISHYRFCWSYECLRPLVDFWPNRTVFVRLWKSAIVDKTGVGPYDQRTSFRTTFTVVRALIRRPPGLKIFLQGLNKCSQQGFHSRAGKINSLSLYRTLVGKDKLTFTFWLSVYSKVSHR